LPQTRPRPKQAGRALPLPTRQRQLRQTLQPGTVTGLALHLRTESEVVQKIIARNLEVALCERNYAQIENRNRKTDAAGLLETIPAALIPGARTRKIVLHVGDTSQGVVTSRHRVRIVLLQRNRQPIFQVFARRRVILLREGYQPEVDA